jgi:NAD(P)-dependent dehydrogenase (short-subunit alcohol dehydrogenase family)
MTTGRLIITGGTSGIGLATVEFFKQKEWDVINVSRGLCPVNGVLNIQVDLSQKDIEIVLKSELSALLNSSDVTILVHNAANLRKDSLDTVDSISFRDVLAVGVIAPSLLNQIILPHMAAGSAIIYLGSTLSEKAVAGAFSYVVSKHATVGLMRATCQDLGDRQIHTACICPGFTDTPMLMNHLNHDQSIVQAIKGMNAQNRLIQPQEIAEVIYFAATHPVVNGALIHANLGQLER